MKDSTPHQGIYVLMIPVRVNGNGYFTPFRSQANLVILHGPTVTLTNTWAAQMRGAVLVSIKKGESFLPVPVLLLLISTVVKELEIIFLAIALLHWMQPPANASGIFKVFIMIYGTGIFPRHLL